MKSLHKALLFAAMCSAPLAAQAAPAAVAVSDCWIRSLPENLPSGGYFKMTNSGGQEVALTGVQTDAFGMAMLHQTQEKNGMSTMAMVKQVAVPAHGSVNFAPGGYHIMLEKPSKPLAPGMSLPVTFVFSNGQKVTAACEVKSAGAMSGSMSGKMSGSMSHSH
ncbi:copper transporter [Candidimonas nitroreducens]|uniref:Copper transporter n=2 Tax=Candidimonas nitroreducens TaxID=683354 RepID=A0A225MXQ8_9BURK|nr:copper transporter [Candidimonas nitroreducens]